MNKKAYFLIHGILAFACLPLLCSQSYLGKRSYQQTMKRLQIDSKNRKKPDSGFTQNPYRSAFKTPKKDPLIPIPRKGLPPTFTLDHLNKNKQSTTAGKDNSKKAPTNPSSEDFIDLTLPATPPLQTKKQRKIALLQKNFLDALVQDKELTSDQKKFLQDLAPMAFIEGRTPKLEMEKLTSLIAQFASTASPNNKSQILLFIQANRLHSSARMTLIANQLKLAPLNSNT